MGKFHQKPVTHVGQVSVNVMDLDRSLAFYRETMGFKVLSRSDAQAVLTADGTRPLLTIERPPGVTPKENGTTGLYHFAVLLPSRADLSAFLRHVLQRGVRLGAADHYVSEALYLNDPDGNGIEVYRDRPDTEWTWSNGEVSMATEPLDGESLLRESGAPWTGMPADALIGHIHLHAAELKQTETFYVKGLGVDIVNRYGGALFMSYGGYHHHIGLNTWNGVGAPRPKKNSVGLNWYTLVFADEAARLETVANLRGIGAGVSQHGDVYVTADPSGNEIHLAVG